MADERTDWKPLYGYEFKNGKWKKTIKAIFHKYF